MRVGETHDSPRWGVMREMLCSGLWVTASLFAARLSVQVALGEIVALVAVVLLLGLTSRSLLTSRRIGSESRSLDRVAGYVSAQLAGAIAGGVATVLAFRVSSDVVVMDARDLLDGVGIVALGLVGVAIAIGLRPTQAVRLVSVCSLIWLPGLAVGSACAALLGGEGSGIAAVQESHTVAALILSLVVAEVLGPGLVGAKAGAGLPGASLTPRSRRLLSA